ncbi:MipA/OmpV family protein [Aquimonas sp.]|jgi:outer membrane scaffolding protein for murein synthesis (MipA/OmpV family)|uniref:MipA/OmpV family protein n=1 Tax=Aquimonas sp. TaxID=1872588 RepID=UPI0037C06DE4
MIHPKALSTAAVVALAAAMPATTAHAQGSIGVAALQEPRFIGSASDRTGPVPLLDIERSRWLAKTLRGAPEFGAYLLRREGFELAAIASIDRGRKAEDSALLSALGGEDIDPFLSFGLVASHSGRIGPAPYEVLIRPLQRTGDSDGLTVAVRGSIGIAELGPFAALAHAQVMWADADAQQLDFSPPHPANVQPASGPLTPAFTARSGVRERRVGLSAQYQLSPRLRLVAQWERRQLASGLLSSGLVEQRTASALTAGFTFLF